LPGVFKAHEPVGVQAFRPQLAVERLDFNWKKKYDGLGIKVSEAQIAFVACTRFRRHQVEVFIGAGITERRGSSSLRRGTPDQRRGVSYAQASDNLGVRPTQLGEEVCGDPQHAFSG
jgi:hypothetical protein